jgi:type I restriction enzyme R subunit
LTVVVLSIGAARSGLTRLRSHKAIDFQQYLKIFHSAHHCRDSSQPLPFSSEANLMSDHATPNDLESIQSQLPALQLLMEMGWDYLSPAECDKLRGGRLGTAILEPVLVDFLRENARFEFKGREHVFTENAIASAVETLKSQRTTGAIHQNEEMYDRLCLGTSESQTIDGDSKSFNLSYIDWKNPEKNSYHCTAEYKVERVGQRKHYIPDIVLFINGLPLGIVECKRNAYQDQSKAPIDLAVGQLLDYQKKDGVPQLFVFSQLLLALARDKAEYGITEQDRAIFALCRPERILPLIFRNIVYDNGIKKIARYQQFFTIEDILKRVLAHDATTEDREGGVVWHTQGSGKSLTMVMLAKALALAPQMLTPKVILVTDRIDLDSQIADTFRHCGIEPQTAKTGKHLVELLQSDKASVVTTLIHKFDAASKSPELRGASRDTFVLVDEGHRGQYAEQHTRMKIALKGACFIAFTGTPLAKNAKKNTFATFGHMFEPPYTIARAVEDKAVLPLVYEARHVPPTKTCRAF